MFKKNLTIFLISLTLILSFTAIFIVIKGTVPQKPKKPEIKVVEEKPQPSNECLSSLRVIAGPTSPPEPSPTPTPYSVDCYIQCESDLNCSHSLVCREDPYRPNQGIKVCLNENCPRERNCWCPGPTGTPVPETPVPTRVITYLQPTTPPTATPTPITIPPVGIVEDTFLGLLAGLSFLTIALLLAF